MMGRPAAMGRRFMRREPEPDCHPGRVRRAGRSRILLANRSLTRVVVGFGLVTVAEWGYVTALSVDAFRRAGAIAIGLVGARLFLAAASSVVSSTVVHRRPPGRALSEVAALRATLVGSSAALAFAGAPVAALIGLLALDAVVSAQYRPAQPALIALLARSPRELVACATGLSTVKTLSQSLGAVLGGLLLAVTTPGIVFTGAALMLAGSAAATLGLSGNGRRGTQGRIDVGLGDVARSTFALVRGPHVGGILLVSGLRTFVRGMWVAIAVIASLRLLHAGSSGVGLLMLAAGAGTLIAAPLSSALVTRRRLGTPAAAALLACGLPLAVIAGVPVLAVAMAVVAVWGAGMAVADVAVYSLLHRLLSTPVVPRITSAIEATKLALEGLGGLLAPLLVSTIGVRGTLLTAAFPLPMVAVGGWRMLHRVDASAGERSALLERLHRVPCLEPLDMASLDGLVSGLTPMEVGEAGVDVVRQHDIGDRFYLIEEGRAQVLVDLYEVGTLGAGDSFGERALVRDVPRTATVRSLTPMQLLVLPRDDFLAAVTGAEGASRAENSPRPADAGHRWSRQDRIDLLSHLPLFSRLGQPALAELAAVSKIHRWAAGAAIVRQGDHGDHFYVLLDGRADVLIDGRRVNDLRPGDQFGEIALLHGVSRSADVIAATPVRALALRRDQFLPALIDGLPAD